MILLSILLITLFAAGSLLALAHLGMASNSPWLLAHIASAVVAYTLFGAAVVCAWVFMQSERSLNTHSSAMPRLPLLTLERWMFGFVYGGFSLLSVSLAAGAMAGGMAFLTRPQHKTIFAVLAWLCFCILITGRLQLGWRGKQAVRLAYFGSIFLLLAYVGTNFVLQFILKRSG